MNKENQWTPFTEDSEIRDIEKAVAEALSENNENIKIFKDGRILGSRGDCKEEDIYRHTELYYVNMIIRVHVMTSRE